MLIDMLSSCRIIWISSFVCKPSVITYPVVCRDVFGLPSLQPLDIPARGYLGCFAVEGPQYPLLSFEATQAYSESPTYFFFNDNDWFL